MNGIIIADKPGGWTSHDVVAKLRGVLGVRRVGHGGTLDPMATGVLPVFAGRATRAVQFCENADKEYIAGLRLGLVTDTQDITGNIISSHEHTVSSCELLEILENFKGAQKQLPPMYSAVKVGGKKLYELARRGIEAPRQPRDIFIAELELLSGSDGDYILRVVCSKGTYIRTLCHDIGQKLGCGGVLSSLRRTRAGAFLETDAVTLDEIQNAAERGTLRSLIKPVDTLFKIYPAITVGGADIKMAKNGLHFTFPGAKDGKCRVYTDGGEFLMLGEIRDGCLYTVKSFFEPAPGAVQEVF